MLQLLHEPLVLEDRERPESSDPLEGLATHEDAALPSVRVKEGAAQVVVRRQQESRPGERHVAEKEIATDHQRIRQRRAHVIDRVVGQLGVRVEEQEDFARRRCRPGIHVAEGERVPHDVLNASRLVQGRDDHRNSELAIVHI
jgi:hypothetical protein